MKIHPDLVIQKNNCLSIFTCIMLLSLTLILFVKTAQGSDVYVSKTGIKRNGKSTVGNWSSSNCYNNLQAAMSAMSGGDTLTIDDGTYSGATNIINGYSKPPSGIAGGFTTIRARHIPGLDGFPLASPLRVYLNPGLQVLAGGAPATYIKYWGLRFSVGNGGYTGWDHHYFKQCAFMGIEDGNTAAMGTGGAYNLFEDCVFYGKGRYKLIFYDYTNSGRVANNLCRRCVARQDWANGGKCAAPDCTNPISTFVSYDNKDDAFLNCIDIDSDSPAYWKDNAGEYDGAFYAPKSTGANMLVQGSIVINNAVGVGSSTGGLGIVYTDVVGVKVGGGVFHKAGGAVNRLTLVNADISQFSYRPNQIPGMLPTNAGIYAGNGEAGPTIATNSIFRTLTNPWVFRSNAHGDYVNTYAVNTMGNIPTHQITTDPLTHGLRYPVRIESGSSLAKSGSDGGQIGARILYKLGVDGSFKGDPDWNTEQGPLWPWPLEDWVKAEMASMPVTINGDEMPLATRGFCAPGQTLTNYIWGYLGNTIPPFNVKISSSGNKTVILAWTANSSDANISGYKVYVGKKSGVYNVNGYVHGKNVGDVTSVHLENLPNSTLYFAVTAVDSIKGESGFSYEVESAPL